MTYSIDEFNRAKAKMASDFDTAINESANPPKAAAGLVETSGNVRPPLVDAPGRTVHKALRAARAADGCVRANPWGALCIAAAAGVVVGLLAARR